MLKSASVHHPAFVGAGRLQGAGLSVAQEAAAWRGRQTLRAAEAV